MDFNAINCTAVGPSAFLLGHPNCFTFCVVLREKLERNISDTFISFVSPGIVTYFKDNIYLNCSKTLSLYRAVNTLRLSYTNQSVNAVQ
jgi:hypothetical protein